MGRAYTEEDWQNMTVAEKWNTDYSRMAYGWASEEEPQTRPANLSDLGNSRMRELKKLQDTSHIGGKDNSFYTVPNPVNLALGNTDNASNLLGSISKYIGNVSGFSDYIKDRDHARNQHIKDKRFQQAALSDGGITAYHPSNAPYNRNAKLRALQSGTFSRDPRTFKLMADQNRMQQGQLRTAESRDDGTINSLGTAAAKDVVLSKLMADQNRMQQGQLNMLPNQVTDVGIPGYKPVQHTPNTGKFFDSMLSTAGLTREDFNKLPNKKKSELRGVMSDYMLKYHGLPSGGGDSQGGSVPVMPQQPQQTQQEAKQSQQDLLGKLNKLMYGNTTDAKRLNIGPNNLPEHARLDRLAILQDKVNKENLAALGQGNDLSAKWQNPGVPDRVFNIQQSPVKPRPGLVKDLNENSAVAKFFANHKGQPLIGDDWFNFKNSALAKALANYDGQGLLGDNWWDIRPGSIIKTIEDLNIPDLEGNNFLEKLANFDANASRGADILMTNDIMRSIWGGDKTSMEDVKDAKNYTGKFPNNSFEDWKTFVLNEDDTKTDDTKTDVKKGDTLGGGGWVDALFKPVAGGAGIWDTNFNRGMEMLEWAGTPLSKRGDHPSKGWRATDTVARKERAALAKAALAASGTSIFGKADHDDIKEALREKLRNRFGMDNWYTYIPGFGKDEAAFESTLSGAALAVQSMIEENNMSFAQAMASFLKE